MTAELEDLIMAASTGKDESIAKLTEKIQQKETEVQELRKSSESFDYLFDAWDEVEDFSAAKATLVIALADRDALDSASFRNALNEAARFLLPPYLESPGILKAVGARDTDVQPHEVSLRAKKLSKVRSGALVNQNDSRNWSQIQTIEKVTATFTLKSIVGSSMNTLPVEIAVRTANFFDPHPEMFPLLQPEKQKLQPSSVYKKLFQMHKLNDLSEEKIRDTVFRIVTPECVAPEAFETWWNTETKDPLKAVKRNVWEARSVLELNTLLQPFAKQGGLQLNEEQAALLSKLFARIRMPMPPKELGMLADAIAILALKNEDAVLKTMFSGLRGRAPFFPAVLSLDMPLKGLEIWGSLALKQLPYFIRVAALLYTPEELGVLACRVPLRSNSAVFAATEFKNQAEAIFSSPKLLADVLLHLWKNRSRLPKNLTQIVDMDHIAVAISMEDLPKEWAAAERELKHFLLDKDDFQKFVIENADGDIPSIIDALQRVRTFQTGECQSLLVKLSHHSAELKARVESGEAKRLMGITRETASNDNMLISSQASVTRLQKELEDLITVQIPENVAAIAHARSLGDFRENAEYDAAKERRRFLHRRRAELEANVQNVSSTKFNDVEIRDRVVLGSMVTLKDGNGGKTVYYILGAWDGDPEKNWISYQTKIGKTLMGVRIGEKVQLPNGEFTLESVEALPESIRKVLAEEA